MKFLIPTRAPRVFCLFPLGYYAEQLSSDDIVSKTDIGNSSTSIRTTKTTKKSSHMYKLSYAGPIVMGVGGECARIFVFVRLTCVFIIGCIFESENTFPGNSKSNRESIFRLGKTRGGGREEVRSISGGTRLLLSLYNVRYFSGNEGSSSSKVLTTMKT